MEKIQSWLYTYISNIDPEFKKLKPTQYLSLNFFTDTSLDSMALMSLILDAEKEFKFTFAAENFQDRRIQTIEGLSRVIQEISTHD